MGCITSSNKLNDLRQDNVFRVRVAHLQPSGPGPEASIVRSGYLELTPRELIFMTPNCESIVWALQHLRRYGLNGDLFSFEAGRRCMSGPGIYTFRIHNAEQLYPMFQRYINAVNTDAFAQNEREREQLNTTNSSVSVLLGRSDLQPHSNNYLEPAPLLARSALQVPQQAGDSIAIDSPDSLPNLQLVATEPDTGNNIAAPQSPITPGVYISNDVTDNNNLFDAPLEPHQYNSNASSEENNTSSSSQLSAATVRHVPHVPPPADLPPKESAPLLNEPLRLYANVDHLLFELPMPPASAGVSERCYENINLLDLPLLPQAVATVTQQQQQQPQQQQHPQLQLQQQQHPQQQQQQPVTPTSPTCVNYIVLDLDQPRSPTHSSPKTMSGGDLSVIDEEAAKLEGSKAGSDVSLSTQQRNKKTLIKPVTTGNKKKTKPKTTVGYATIDFIRTYALNKSSTATPHDGEMAVMCQHHQDHSHEDGELRITRHSKCLHKANSISE